MVVYLSFDVEADNKTPTVGSMRQLGIYTDGAEFSINILPQQGEGISENHDTVKWLKEQGVYDALSENAVTPREAMTQLNTWLRDVVSTLEGPKTRFKWIAKPAAFDWTWLICYWHKYGPEDKLDIGFKATCISTMRDDFFAVYFAAHPDKDRGTASELERRMMEGSLKHDAVDDARKQYMLFNKIRVMLPLIVSLKKQDIHLLDQLSN